MKRRRERDRPKAAHDAAFNPYKRVLLSYGSEDEAAEGTVDQLPGTGHPAAAEELNTHYQFKEYEEDATASSEAGADANAQAEQEAGSAGDGAEDGGNQSTSWSQTSRRNVITGQWTALGRPTYEEDEQDHDERDSLEEEAMAYLQSVM
jgi:hypothetical protein